MKRLSLEPWDEAVGILRDTTEIGGTLSVKLYLSSTGEECEVILPDILSEHIANNFTGMKPGTKVGILRVPGNGEPFRVRRIKGGI